MGIEEGSRYYNYLTKMAADEFSLQFSPLPIAQYFSRNFDGKWFYAAQK